MYVECNLIMNESQNFMMEMKCLAIISFLKLKDQLLP